MSTQLIYDLNSSSILLKEPLMFSYFRSSNLHGQYTCNATMLCLDIDLKFNDYTPLSNQQLLVQIKNAVKEKYELYLQNPNEYPGYYYVFAKVIKDFKHLPETPDDQNPNIMFLPLMKHRFNSYSTMMLKLCKTLEAATKLGEQESKRLNSMYGNNNFFVSIKRLEVHNENL